MKCSPVLPIPMVVLGACAFGQNHIDARPITQAVKNAGIYHVATGTWTRNTSSLAGFGADVIFANNAPSGYFTDLNNSLATGDHSLIDEGRLPDPSSAIALADRVTYEVNAIEFGYCTDQLGPVVEITFGLYESYLPCDLLVTAPLAPFVLSGNAAATGLPGTAAAGAITCWTLTLDLDGMDIISMQAEGGSAFPGRDDNLDTDSFGIEWAFNGAARTFTGPMLAGDPDWTTSVPGALLWGGGGTYYDPPGAVACASTGLDIQDQVAVDGSQAGLPPGCYFFGGYKNNNGCGFPPEIRSRLSTPSFLARRSPPSVWERPSVSRPVSIPAAMPLLLPPATLLPDLDSTSTLLVGRIR